MGTLDDSEDEPQDWNEDTVINSNVGSGTLFLCQPDGVKKLCFKVRYGRWEFS